MGAGDRLALRYAAVPAEASPAADALDRLAAENPAARALPLLRPSRRGGGGAATGAG